ncbi:20957_t:CDS:2 [Entrophospora sp. SA101]|nr:20957_t:CDS:2 [Entrophospora sp. SA101]
MHKSGVSMSKSASSFNLEDMKALNMKFAGSEDQTECFLDFEIGINEIDDLELPNPSFKCQKW